jgi:tetratricopeptide (TPR) repeat protein
MRLGTIVVAGLLALPSFALAAPQDCGGADLDRRIVACTQIIQRGGQSPANMAMIYVNRGSAYGDKQDYARAIADYSKALQLNPNYADAYYSRGTVYLRMNDNDRAIGDISQTLRLNPNHAYAYFNRGLAYQNKADYTRAIADYDQAVRLNPALGDAYQHAAVALNGRGDAYLKAGDYDRAIADYNRSIQLQPNSYWPYSHRGDAYRRKGDLERAIADLDQALGLSPGLNEALTLRGLAYRAKGDLRRAKADFSSAANSAPTGFNAEIYQEMARQQLSALAETTTSPTGGQASAAAAPSGPADPAAAQASLNTPASSAAAADSGAKPSSLPGKRVALVIGNDDYENLPDLKKAVNDSRSVGQALTRLGFDVTVVENAPRRTINARLAEFTGKVGPGDTAFFFFAGHGVQISGTNYLMPVDTPEAREGQERFVMGEGIPADGIVQQVQERGAKVAMLVLDACRDNPFAKAGTRGVGGTRGLTIMTVPEGVFVIYSAGIGETALDRLGDDDPDPNSVFTRTFVKLLGEPGLTVHSIAKRTQQDVHELAKSVSHAQMPAYYDQILGELTLLPNR